MWPSGTVTFLFSDIEGSTRRWEHDRALMSRVLVRHDELLDSAVLGHGGLVVKRLGDGMLAVFESASDAVQAAVTAQRTLATEPWPTEPVRVRMGLHSGDAGVVGGDYLGPTVNRAARVMAAAWGEQVLCTQATVELARDRLAEGLSFRRLGEHRLRDLPHPVALWQVVGEGLRAEFPEVRSVGGAVGNLPASLSSFVGREGEVHAVAGELSAARVLTLTGVGGVGKTRLALEAARHVEAEMFDGVWWCPLAPLGDEAAVLGVVASLFGLVQEPGRPLRETLVDHLRSKELLLVVDNCEHLLDTVAELVEALCGPCRGLRVLATSRESLGVPGEVIRPVRPLVGEEALALFVERARAVEPDFVADDASRDICRRLDGIPLALEMAAARLGSLQAGEIAARLDERFRLLVGSRRAAERQQTLRATVAWSHDLLSEPERRVFRRLAVFAGSFDLAAAEAVTIDEALDAVDVDDLLSGLVNKSLVVADHSGQTGTRFSLLETIRQYGEEQLGAAGESDQRRRKAAIYFSDLVARAAIGLRGVEEPLWADRIALELDNLRACWRWALGAEDTALALALFAPLPPTSLAEPIAYEIFNWVEPTMALPGADQDPNYWAAANWRCLRSLNLGDWDGLRAWRSACGQLPGADERPEPHFGDALLALVVDGDFPAAVIAYQEAADAYSALGDGYHHIRHAAMSLWCRLGLGVDDSIHHDMERVADAARRVGSPYMAAFGIGGPPGAPAFILQEPERAVGLLDEAISYAIRSRNQFAHRTLRAAQVLALTILGDPAALAPARDLLTSTTNRNQITLQLGCLSVALSALGEHHEAAEIIGCLNRAQSAYTYWQNIPRMVAAWNCTRQALGDQTYESAVAKGAAQTYEEIIAGVNAFLERLAAGGHHPLT